MIRLVLTLIIILECNCANAQVARPHFAVGIAGGYKSTQASYGLVVEYLMYNHVDINLGIAARLPQGVGVSLGTKYYPLGVNKFSGYLGINYAMLPGATFAIDHDAGSFSGYRTNANQYIIPGLGASYNEDGLHLYASINYSGASNEPTTQCTSGIADAATIAETNRAMNSGIGFTLGLMLHWW